MMEHRRQEGAQRQISLQRVMPACDECMGEVRETRCGIPSRRCIAFDNKENVAPFDIKKTVSKSWNVGGKEYDEWRQATSPDGEAYVYNRRTRRASWEVPEDAVAVDAGEGRKLVYISPRVDQLQKKRTPLAGLSREGHFLTQISPINNTIEDKDDWHPRVSCTHCGIRVFASDLDSHLSSCAAHQRFQKHHTFADLHPDPTRF